MRCCGACAEVDLVLKFRTGETWAVKIKCGLSTVLKPGFFSAVEDVAADKAFVVDGGEESDRLKPGIEAFGLKSLQQALLAREQGE